MKAEQRAEAIANIIEAAKEFIETGGDDMDRYMDLYWKTRRHFRAASESRVHDIVAIALLASAPDIPDHLH